MENTNRIMIPKSSQSLLNQSKSLNKWIKRTGLDKASNQKQITNLSKAAQKFQIDNSTLGSQLKLLAKFNQKNGVTNARLQKQLNQSKEFVKKVNWNTVQHSLGVRHSYNTEKSVNSYNADSQVFSNDLGKLIGIPGNPLSDKQEKNLRETYVTVNNTEYHADDTHSYQKIIWDNYWKLHNTKTLLVMGDIGTIITIKELIVWFIKMISKIWN